MKNRIRLEDKIRHPSFRFFFSHRQKLLVAEETTAEKPGVFHFQVKLFDNFPKLLPGVIGFHDYGFQVLRFPLQFTGSSQKHPPLGASRFYGPGDASSTPVEGIITQNPKFARQISQGSIGDYSHGLYDFIPFKGPSQSTREL
jgi:hypothetical protein